MLKNLFRFIAIFVVFCVSSVFAQESDEQIISKNYRGIPVEKLLPKSTLPLYKSENIKFDSDDVAVKTNFPTHLDLTEYLGLKGAERNQGTCGACWVWSGLGCLEGQFNKALKEGKFEGVKYVANQKFSLNFVEGKIKKYPWLLYEGKSMCDGGNSDELVNLLMTNDGMNYLVPMSNRNADETFEDTNTYSLATKYLDYIQTTPHVTLNKLEVMDVVSDLENPTKAKNEIIQALNDGYFVEIYFYLREWGWIVFDESTQHYFGDYDSPSSNGHAVLIVGYDTSDPDPNKHYWIVQNSWGINENRPNGQIRFNINSGFKPYTIFAYHIYKAEFKLDNEVCDNLDNDCNTVIDDGCTDLCPDNPEKSVAGACGCDTSDLDSDFDGTPDCFDGCPYDKEKVDPGVCGCGVADDELNTSDGDNDGVVNCLEDNYSKYTEVKLGSHYIFSNSLGLCAKSTENNLYCLGAGKFLGTGESGTRSVLMQVNALKGVSSFDLGFSHSCAVAKDEDNKNTVYCWGLNSYGETGTYNSLKWADELYTPKKIELDISSPVSVTTGFQSTCITSDNGKTYCFGDNTAGKLGRQGSVYKDGNYSYDEYEGTCFPNQEYSEGQWRYNGEMLEVPLNNISAMKMKSYETAAISNGKVYTYGLHSPNQKRYQPATRYNEFMDVKALSMSETDLCAITKNSKLYCSDLYSGDPYNEGPRDNDPMNLIPLDNVSAVSAGSGISISGYQSSVAEAYGAMCYAPKVGGGKEALDYLLYFGDDPESHICAVSNGELYCWGRGNSYGQLGSDRDYDYEVPTKVEGVKNVSSLVASGGITCYISHGDIYCFGDLMPLGINKQTSTPCRISRVNDKVADFVQPGDSCTYLGGSCGHYSYMNGYLVCRPCSEAVDYGSGNNAIQSCYEGFIQEPVEPEPTPSPSVCPKKITTSIEAQKVSGKKIKVTMKEVEGRCFSGKYKYRVRLIKKGNKKTKAVKLFFNTNKPVMTTKKLKSGLYNVSYRVQKQVIKKTRVKGKVVKKKVFKPVTNFSKAVKVKIK